MASGCILDTCIYCGEFVWEDEDYGFTDNMDFYHKECINKFPYWERENQILKRRILELEER